MAVVDQPSVDRVVEVLSVIYEQEIKELAQTPFINNPNRDLFKVSSGNCVSEEDLATHVVFLEHIMSDPTIRVCFYTFRAAMIALDKKSDNKLTVQANPLWITSWVNREAAKISGIWSYAQRRTAGRKQKDGTIKMHFSRCTTVQRLKQVKVSPSERSESSNGSGVSRSMSDVASPGDASGGVPVDETFQVPPLPLLLRR